MSKKNNAFGRKVTRVFKLVFGPDFAAEWAVHSWDEAPSKFVVFPNSGVVFLGFVDSQEQGRRGFLISAEDALLLADALKRNGEIARSIGEQKND